MLPNPQLELPSSPMTSRAPAQFATLKRVPAYLQVSERIRAAILGGEIPAGELLPTETELATQFGVTRSTVREAIRLLEQGGLLGRAGRKRLAVRLPSLESASRSISVAMVLTLWRPGRRSVTEAMWLGSISLRSMGMDWVVKRARWVVTTAGVGPG